MNKLTEALQELLDYHAINVADIKDVEQNCGTVYFTYSDNTYALSIMETEAL